MDETGQAKNGEAAPEDVAPSETAELENSTATSEDGEPDPDEAPESDDGDTVEGETDEEEGEPEDSEDEDGEAEDERGPIPYNRFRSVNEEKKRYALALEKAGFRLDPVTNEPVPIGEGWDVEGDEPAIPPQQVGRLGERPDDPNEWTEDEWHGYAREKGYNPDGLDDNFWNLIGQMASGESQAASAQRQQQAAMEQQARLAIDQTIGGAAQDKYLALAPEAVADLTATVKRARGRGIPYSRIAADMPYLRAAVIEQHLDSIIAAASGHAAKTATRAEAERRQRLSAQPATSGTAPPQKAPVVTGEVKSYAAQTGIPADRLAAELQKIQKTRGEQ